MFTNYYLLHCLQFFNSKSQIMIKTYDKYFIKLFCEKLLLIFLIFFSLTFILTIFEEITFFNETQSEFYLPFLIAMMDVPTTIL